MPDHRSPAVAGRRPSSTALLLLASTLAALTGCADEPLAPSEPAASPLHHAAPRISQDSVRAVRQTALDVLTRAAALALQDNGLRQRLQQDLRQSRHTVEHKLQFNEYIHGNGGILLAKMSQHTGVAPDSLLALLGVFDRSLEVYVPVDEHRARWSGSGDLVVAGQVTEHAEIVGYHLNGSRVDLALAGPPSTPTLVIVPNETNFASELSAEWVNDDESGTAIGTYRKTGAGPQLRPNFRHTVAPRTSGASAAMIPPDPCDLEPWLPECQTPPTAYPAGLFVKQSYIPDLGESWVRGDPEIDVFLVGASFNGWGGPTLSCAGNGAGSAPVPDGRKWFDQNGEWWVRNPYAAVQGMLFSEADITQYRLWYTADYSFTIQFWEDDNGACAMRGNGTSNLIELAQDLRDTWGFASVILDVTFSSVGSFYSWALSAANAFNAMTTGEDQLLGVTTPQGLAGYNYSDATHILVREGHLVGVPTGNLEENGRVMLELRNP